MTTSKGTRKVCKKGHVFFKSSDCPVCPKCEEERKPVAEFMSVLSAPARRALENAGIKTIKQLAKYSEKELLAMHGFGPGAIPKLKVVLKKNGLTFRK